MKSFLTRLRNKSSGKRSTISSLNILRHRVSLILSRVRVSQILNCLLKRRKHSNLKMLIIEYADFREEQPDEKKKIKS
jgi:hypothetical protein